MARGVGAVECWSGAEAREQREGLKSTRGQTFFNLFNFARKPYAVKQF
jgi:hypothetical protein